MSAAQTTPTSPTIEVSDVSKWFGSVVAVNEVSLTVEPGITGLLGPNGAGKTTLLYMIVGLSKPSRGDVTALGQPVRNNPEIYRRVGFMPEREAIYPFSPAGSWWKRRRSCAASSTFGTPRTVR